MATVAEIINAMPERFQADKAGDMNAVVMFDLSGEGGGKWHAKIADGSMTVHEGPAENPKATIIMDAEDFVKMSSGELNAMMAFMSGKIKVDGDLNTVMKFQTVVGL